MVLPEGTGAKSKIEKGIINTPLSCKFSVLYQLVWNYGSCGGATIFIQV
jgi:hypothetical protein